MAQGTIKKLVSEKGFGFISGDKGDVFFHHSGLVGATIESLQEGQSVSYEIEQGKGGKGPRAINVTPE
jgi:CspA family cold shock protein